MKAVDKWAKAFEDIDLQKATAGFYAGHGYSQFNARRSPRTCRASSSVSSAIASTPGGSGHSGPADPRAAVVGRRRWEQ